MDETSAHALKLLVPVNGQSIASAVAEIENLGIKINPFAPINPEELAKTISPLSDSLLKHIDARLEEIDIRVSEFNQIFKDDPAWDGFLEDLIKSIPDWIADTALPSELTTVLKSLFEDINHNWPKNFRTSFMHFREDAKYEIIYQLVVRPMISAVKNNLQPLHGEVISQRIAHALEAITSWSAPHRKTAKVQMGMSNEKFHELSEPIWNGARESLTKKLRELDSTVEAINFPQ
ncbi:hypothetical protein H6CHR_03110 [Variovorax sp. PBL-H6]|uniref:hypothetical protein n=1 Tax=Variovorax sp. PBL-H6 TaxID=434009 RepID=UPI001315FBB6|nr:hypothetical protein [Variovorax sp. PBL-H6]VTU29023.1 hypothetical protein H6CHR_03110 [Variovorax sp. PBL-H6]